MKRKSIVESSMTLFRFTDADEERMEYAIKQAVKYMERYGQGQKHQDMVDLRHYARAPKADGGACENTNEI